MHYLGQPVFIFDDSDEAVDLVLGCYDTVTIWHTAVPGFTSCGSIIQPLTGKGMIGSTAKWTPGPALQVQQMVMAGRDSMLEEMRLTFCVSATPSAQLM